MAFSSNGLFSVGTWTIDPALNRISHNGQTTLVEPRVMQVLTCLAERPGEVITREQLMETVWTDTYVSEVTLTRCISELRKVFADDPQNPQVIETIRKAGYRLIAPVAPLGERSAPALSPSAGLASRWPYAPAFGLGLMTAMVLAFLVLLWTRGPTSTSTQPDPLYEMARPFTSFPGREYDVAMVPHGDQVAFSWAGPQGDNIDLYLKQVNSEALLRLTDHPGADRHPAWSVDGKQIAFVRQEEDGCGLFVLPALGGQAQRLTGCHAQEVYGLSWSPSGRWLVFADRDSLDAPYSLFMVATETGETKKLTTPPPFYLGDRYPVFSRGGRAIAFTRSRLDGVEDVYLLSLPDHRLRRLTEDHRPITGLDWTQGGEGIVYSADRQGAFELWHLAIDTLLWSHQAPLVPARLLAHRAEHAFQPSISRSSYGLAFEQRSRVLNIGRQGLAPAKTQQPFLSSTQMDAYPQISPDGWHVTFVSSRTGFPELWWANLDGTNPIPLTTFGDAFTANSASWVGPGRWSPDGTLVTFEAQVDAYRGIYLLDVESRTMQRLTPEAFDAVAPSWSHDGRWVYFGANHEGAWNLWKMRPAGTDTTQVTHQGGFAAFESPDGTGLYFSKHAQPGLWYKPLEGEGETLILPTLAAEQVRYGVMRGEGFYLLTDHDTAAPTLSLLDLTTQTIREVAVLDGKAYGPGFALSSDGRTLLYTRLDHDESDLMLLRTFYSR